MIRTAALILTLTATGCATPQIPPLATRAQPDLGDLPPARAFAPTRPVPALRSNADIARDFLDLHFQLEGGSTLPVFTRIEGPITLRLNGDPASGTVSDLNALLRRLEDEAGIHITRTNAPDARITIEAVPRAEIRRALPRAACFVVPNVSSLSEYRRNRRNVRTSWPDLRDRSRLSIFVPNDASQQEVRDCLHEELAQALGPLNDLYRLPDSVFNDDNAHVVLTGFDMLILRAAYAPELTTGMSRSEVAARLPALLARLNPTGETIAARPLPDTPRDWANAIETALVPGTRPDDRLRAANEAARLARSYGWQDHRRGFSHHSLGRVLRTMDPDLAHQHQLTAMRYLQNQSGLELQRARVAAELAAYEISRGNTGAALDLLGPATAAAAQGQNASLLASLRLQEADALALAGRTDEARAVRLDSLGWARYGFGPEWAERAKQQTAALTRK